MRPNNYPHHGLSGRRYQQTYERLLAAQFGVCVICKKPREQVLRQRFCIDHCHETGKIRGILCEHCNIYLGYIENYGCDEFHTKLPLSESRGIANQKEYDLLHERSERWVKSHREAVMRYLSAQ